MLATASFLNRQIMSYNTITSNNSETDNNVINKERNQSSLCDIKKNQSDMCRQQTDTPKAIKKRTSKHMETKDITPYAEQ